MCERVHYDNINKIWFTQAIRWSTKKKSNLLATTLESRLFLH